MIGRLHVTDDPIPTSEMLQIYFVLHVTGKHSSVTSFSLNQYCAEVQIDLANRSYKIHPSTNLINRKFRTQAAKATLSSLAKTKY